MGTLARNRLNEPRQNLLTRACNGTPNRIEKKNEKVTKETVTHYRKIGPKNHHYLCRHCEKVFAVF